MASFFGDDWDEEWDFSFSRDMAEETNEMVLVNPIIPAKVEHERVFPKTPPIQAVYPPPIVYPRSAQATDQTCLMAYESLINDPIPRYNPARLHLIPTHYWEDRDLTFAQLVSESFHKKNSANCRFPHKLYNALILSQLNHIISLAVGVHWVDDSIICVTRLAFARLLGIKSVEGSLFHQQGNFPSHGFVEMDSEQVRKMFPDFDFGVQRLIYHSPRKFVRGCSEADIGDCKWAVVSSLSTIMTNTHI